MRKASRFRNRLISAILYLFAGAVSGHEFWIEPHDFTLETGEQLIADIKVGQELVGNKHFFLPDKFLSFTLTQNTQTRPISSRTGDMPPLKEENLEDGLAIISYASNARHLRYAQAGKFQNFLEYEGISWVKAKHIERKLPAKGFKELYYRYAKSLVKVGSGTGEDTALGLPFELVITHNPYLNPESPIEATLLWQAQPFPNAQVSVFFKEGTSTTPAVTRQLFTSNEQGKVTIPRPQKSGMMLLNAVHMAEPSPETTAKTQAVWESYWASTTFALE